MEFAFYHNVGSTDTTLKLWKGKTCLHTFAGHSGWSHPPSFSFLHALLLICCTFKFSLNNEMVSGEICSSTLFNSVLCTINGMDYLWIFSFRSNPFLLLLNFVDTVRGLAEMHGLGILSASHDGWVVHFISFLVY